MEQRVETLAHKAEQAPEPSLKAEIGEQQEQRGQLRRMLEEERRKLSALSREEPPRTQVSPEMDAVTLTPSSKPTLSDYTDAVRETLQSLPPHLATKAVLAAGRIPLESRLLMRSSTGIVGVNLSFPDN